METSLVDLVGQWQQVAELMMDPECDPQTILDTLEGIEGEIEVKADGYGAVIRKMEFEQAALKGKKEYVKAILDQITKMDKHLENQIGWMKDRLKDAMIATGKDEEGIKTDKYTFKVNEDDDAKIREYLKDHDCDWARLLPRTTYLDIKGV